MPATAPAASPPSGSTLSASDAAIAAIREYPRLALDLVRARTRVTLPPRTIAVLDPVELSHALPDDLLAHTTVVFADAATGEPALAILIEPEGRDDETIDYVWPCSVATASAILHCPVYLLVICPDLAEAARCNRVIRTGHPGFDLIPLIIDQRTLAAVPAGSRGWPVPPGRASRASWPLELPGDGHRGSGQVVEQLRVGVARAVRRRDQRDPVAGRAPVAGPAASFQHR